MLLRLLEHFVKLDSEWKAKLGNFASKLSSTLLCPWVSIADLWLISSDEGAVGILESQHFILNGLLELDVAIRRIQSRRD